jgi:hypothetical protein
MANPQKRKGDAAEREIAKILADQLGFPVRRKLGAGRTDDEGDLEGVPDWTLEVKNYADVARGITKGLADCEREQQNAATTFGAALVRRPRGGWFAVMTVEQLATVIREAS